jgi:hypothetical protein
MLSIHQLFSVALLLICHISKCATSAFQSIASNHNIDRIQQQQQPLSFWVPSSATTTSIRQTQTKLKVIKADDNDFIFDEGAGGVQLATASIIKLIGTVKHGPGKAEAIINDLVRYTKLKKVELDKNNSNLVGTILCTGTGKELYKDPGTSTDATIVLASNDAVKNALGSAKSAMTSTALVINLMGSSDSQVLEILESIRKLVLSLDVPTKTKISFNSISTSDMQPLTSTVTVVSFDETSTSSTTSSSGQTSIDKAIASGELYFNQGSYYTLLEDDINTAVA